MTAPGADGVVPDPLGRGGRPPGRASRVDNENDFH